MQKKIFLIISFTFYLLPGSESIMKYAQELSAKTSCYFQFEFITLCFAVFVEWILPINIAALSVSELHLDD